jgi:hypothetical protein
MKKMTHLKTPRNPRVAFFLTCNAYAYTGRIATLSSRPVALLFRMSEFDTTSSGQLTTGVERLPMSGVLR